MKKTISIILIILIVCSTITIHASELTIDFNKTYTYKQLIKDIDKFKQRYPNLIKTETIGKSVQNRDIVLLKVGKGDTNIVLLGGVHARELAQTPVLMKLIESYCEAYNYNFKLNGYDIKEILDSVTFYIVPLVNPDGYILTTEGLDSIKDNEIKNNLINMRNNYMDDYVRMWIDGTKFSEWKANINGVDINRNFPVKRWNLVINTPNHLTYKTKPSYSYYSGESPGSEPETKAVVNLLDSINFYGFIDFHSKGKIIYYYNFFENNEYNKLQKEIVTAFYNLSGYKPVAPAHYKKIVGGEGISTNYVAETFGKPSFTVETVTEHTLFPIDTKYFYKVYDNISSLPLYLAKKATQLKETNYYPYKVYIDNVFKKDFKVLEKATKYAKQYDDFYIIKNNKKYALDKTTNILKEVPIKEDDKPLDTEKDEKPLEPNNNTSSISSFFNKLIVAFKNFFKK